MKMTLEEAVFNYQRKLSEELLDEENSLFIRSDNSSPDVGPKEAILLFNKKVIEKAKEVDPDDNHDWSTLAYGFLLALNFNALEALELSLIISYNQISFD